ncbi:MAG: gliding motility-associated C-terminal domain-containing protein [Bacteroidota bacterium]
MNARLQPGHGTLRFLPILLLFFSVALGGQTVLEPGDLLVLGANTNNGACMGGNGEDRISFVCFKDIEPGTTIDITDNGWERLNPNTFGNSESIVRMTRTGNTIPAGTIISILLPAVGGDYFGTAPDSNWDFTPLNTLANLVNLNAGGDQLIFMQGGTWFDGSSTGLAGFSQDATYTGGRILFGFNTSTTWNAFVDDTQNSGLPPEIASCFNMAPAGSASDYLSYNGPFTEATQLEWINRVSDPNNWQSFADCATYQAPLGTIPVATSGISLSCSVCDGCGIIEETVFFNLPTVGGPFIVEYKMNEDTILASNLSNGDSVVLLLDTFTAFDIVSVTDANSCPVFSNFEGGFTTTIAPFPTANSLSRLRTCEENNGLGIFDLTQGDTLIKGPNSGTVLWFTNNGNLEQILDPTNFEAADSIRVFAQVIDQGCPSVAVGVDLFVNPRPDFSFTFNGDVCDSTCFTMDVNFDGQRPFFLVYGFSFEDDSQLDTLISLTPSQSIDICPADFPEGSTPVSIRFVSIADFSCTIPLNDTIVVYNGGPVETDLNQNLCQGDSLLVNGVVYNAANPMGQEIIVGGAANGCDSIINVLLNFESTVSGSLSAPAAICPGEEAFLTFELSGGSGVGYTVELLGSDGTTLSLSGVQNGAQFPVNPIITADYTLVSVSSDGSGCMEMPNSVVTIEVSDYDIDIEPAVEYNGFGVSCPTASDGALRANVTGTTGPYAYIWSTGDTTALISGLAAGTYELDVLDVAGCAQNTSFTINEPNPISVQLNLDTSACSGQASELVIEQISGGVGNYRYGINGGTLSSINSLPLTDNSLMPGNYTLNVVDANNCTTDLGISLGSDEALTVSLGPDRSIKQGETTVIVASTTFTPTTITWENAESGTFINDLELSVAPEISSTYGVTVESANGCTATDFINIFVEENRGYYAPTGFSPNEDGFNDTFTLFGGENVTQFNNFRIFNRWGTLVYERLSLLPNDELNGWNGFYQGQLAPSGTYIFSAEVELTNGQREVISGDFALLR